MLFLYGNQMFTVLQEWRESDGGNIDEFNGSGARGDGVGETKVRRRRKWKSGHDGKMSDGLVLFGKWDDRPGSEWADE